MKQKAIKAWLAGKDFNNKNCNLIVEGDTIYSYGSHWPLGKLFGKIALVCNRSRSSSTNQHSTEVRWACYKQGIQTINVDWIGAKPAENLVVMDQEIEAEKARIARARTRKEDDHLKSLIANRQRYVNYTNGEMK